LLAALGRDEVVAAVCPDLLTGGEPEELRVPPLRVHMLKTEATTDGILGVKERRRVALGHDLRIVVARAVHA
jgi:hypothetical protein